MIHDLNSIITANAYSDHLKSRPDDYEKPIVYFTGKPTFSETLFPGHKVAHVQALNHPYWGCDKLRTSSVLYEFDDGSFETRNTIYKPYVEPTDVT